ncbi:hypothetical protein OsJ_09932 [Oryza sativa Japonica Group]|uniref:Uncharacterized protein n=2 Tax=Oryza sativa subsp. japonica TaxID=39947 RepID=A0A8J8XHA1_ORYSJ|nr:hypothetical protein LOC_Os03g11810 [Oryza sativa Japonica Group]EAZ26077.1 hypothetical protein OsJ_09932 [Oryza sativa Japonica Group]
MGAPAARRRGGRCGEEDGAAMGAPAVEERRRGGKHGDGVPAVEARQRKRCGRRGGGRGWRRRRMEAKRERFGEGKRIAGDESADRMQSDI